MRLPERPENVFIITLLYLNKHLNYECIWGRNILERWNSRCKAGAKNTVFKGTQVGEYDWERTEQVRNTWWLGQRGCNRRPGRGGLTDGEIRTWVFTWEVFVSRVTWSDRAGAGDRSQLEGCWNNLGARRLGLRPEHQQVWKDDQDLRLIWRQRKQTLLRDCIWRDENARCREWPGQLEGWNCYFLRWGKLWKA